MQPRPPGPRGVPLLGMLPALRRDPIGVFNRAAQRYGEVTCFRIGPRRGFLITNPNDIRRVLQDNARNYHKSPLYENLRKSIGNGLLTSEDDFWLRQRRIAQPAFHRQRVSGLARVMAEAARETADEWQSIASQGRAVDISDEMMRFTRTVVLRALLGGDLGPHAARIDDAWETINEHIGNSFWSLGIVERFQRGKARRFDAARMVLRQAVEYVIDDRRRRPSESADLLSMLLAARDEETGEAMTDEQLRVEVTTFLLAGQETTSLALTWTWYLLSQHPAARKKLEDELDAVLGGRAPEYSDLAHLPYTRMVVDEAMRLYPPAWGFSRQALADDTLGGFTLPRGWLLADGNCNRPALRTPRSRPSETRQWHSPPSSSPAWVSRVFRSVGTTSRRSVLACLALAITVLATSSSPDLLAQRPSPAAGPWSGQAQCIVVSKSQDYLDEQTHTWRLTGEPSTPAPRGSAQVYYSWPAVWNVQGSGRKTWPSRAPANGGEQVERWTIAHEMPMLLRITDVGSGTERLRIGTEGQRGAPPGAVRVTEVSGRTREQSIQQWPFPAIEDSVTTMTIAGTSTRTYPEGFGVGQGQPPKALTTATCTWSFTRGSVEQISANPSGGPGVPRAGSLPALTSGPTTAPDASAIGNLAAATTASAAATRPTTAIPGTSISQPPSASAAAPAPYAPGPITVTLGLIARGAWYVPAPVSVNLALRAEGKWYQPAPITLSFDLHATGRPEPGGAIIDVPRPAAR